MESPTKPNAAIISIVVVVLLAVAAAGVSVLTKSTPDTVATSTVTSSSSMTVQTSNPATSSTSTPTMSMGAACKDGTYTANAPYLTPGGRDSLSVTLAVANNIVTSVSISQNPTSGDSERYQSAFERSYKTSVVGKDINSIDLSRVSGASLTSNGFNSALDTIKNNARA